MRSFSFWAVKRLARFMALAWSGAVRLSMVIDVVGEGCGYEDRRVDLSSYSVSEL
jgi:hypothetical protein